MTNSMWYKNALFYEVYVRAFFDSNNDGHGDLQGLRQKLDYLQELGVDCLWLLPIYPSPLMDDGYDISDFYGVLSEYGSVEDFKSLVEEVHARGMHIIADLVLNHTSDQHPWFQSARANANSPYREYYVWSDTDQKYQDARIIFLDTEASNWTWDEVAGEYYWHRFYSSQPDLNYDSPAVRADMLKVMGFWLDMGIDGFRADAVPYLIEREGTSCENLPETHAYLKELRQFIDKNYPGRILLSEANQWPEDVRLYFGDGDEFHMGFHFPVMPRIFMAIHKGERAALEWILERTPSIPENCQWCIFLRNHDELTLEMVTEEERQWMWHAYAPTPRMRQNLGIRRRLAPLMDNDRRKIELANSLLFTLPGTPIIYYGDEIGMGDDIWLPDRNGLRTPMQWNDGPNAGFSGADAEELYSPVVSRIPYDPSRVNVAAQKSDPGSLFILIRRMASLRKERLTFGWGDFKWARCSSAAVAAYFRSYHGETLLILNNLSPKVQEVVIDLPGGKTHALEELLSGSDLPAVKGGQLILSLEGYRYLWLKL